MKRIVLATKYQYPPTMKINLLPLKYGEHIPAASTPLNIIQRGYKVLLAACAEEHVNLPPWR